MSCSVDVLWLYLGQTSSASGKRTRKLLLKYARTKGWREFIRCNLRKSGNRKLAQLINILQKLVTNLVKINIISILDRIDR